MIPSVYKVIILAILHNNCSVIIECTVSVQNRDPVKLRGFSITDFISKQGYPVEAHKNIQTKDGYLLDLHRIPDGIVQNRTGVKPAVLLMHGLLGSSENFIILGANKGLAFLLADRGYDVWMGNARGNVHSRKHVRYNPDKDAKYWQFSWNEIGINDLPAMINYILRTTNQNKLSYVGHSQGTTSFFVMASDVPKYNMYINLMVALAPVAFMTTGAISGNYLTIYQQGINAFINEVGMNELKSSSANDVCINLRINNLCFNSLMESSSSIDPNISRLIKKTFPAGASTRQLLHYNQEYFSGQFAHYDYGPSGNLAKYNSVVPPNYNLNRVSSPVALFYATRDNIASPQVVTRLSKRLPNVVLNYLVPSPTFTHLDFVTSKNVVNLVYRKVLSLMDRYNT